MRTDVFFPLFLVARSVKDMTTRTAHGASGLVTQRLEANAALRGFVDVIERSRHLLVISPPLNLLLHQRIVFFLQFLHRVLGVEVLRRQFETLVYHFFVFDLQFLHRFLGFKMLVHHFIVFDLQFLHRFLGVEVVRLQFKMLVHHFIVFVLQFIHVDSLRQIVFLKAHVVFEEGLVHGVAGVGSHFPGVVLALENGVVEPTRLVHFLV